MADFTTLNVLALALFIYIAYRYISRPSRVAVQTAAPSTQSSQQLAVKSVMSAPRDDLDPSKEDPFTSEQLKIYDGSNTELPIYVAVRGTIFDVTRKAEMYGPEKSYNIFAGKDGSRRLAMPSLKPENVIADCSDLSDKQRKVLDDWHTFFTKRYNIVGKIVDPSAADYSMPVSPPAIVEAE